MKRFGARVTIGQFPFQLLEIAPGQGFCIDIASIDYATASPRWAFCPARSDPDFFYRQPHSHLHLRRRQRGKRKAVLRKTTAPKLLEGSWPPRRDERGGSGDRRRTHR